jgi:hypothetical protein
VDFRRNIVVEEVFVDMLRRVEEVDTFDIVAALGERIADRLVEVQIVGVEVHKIVEEVGVDFESVLIPQHSILWDIEQWVDSTDTLVWQVVLDLEGPHMRKELQVVDLERYIPPMQAMFLSTKLAQSSNLLNIPFCLSWLLWEYC